MIIKSARLGNAAVSAIRLGNQLVWPSPPPVSNLYPDPGFSDSALNSTRSNRTWVVSAGKATWSGPGASDFYLNNSNVWGESAGMVPGTEYTVSFTVKAVSGSIWVNWYASDPWVSLGDGQSVGTTEQTISFNLIWESPQTFIGIWVGGPAIISAPSIMGGAPVQALPSITNPERGFFYYTETHEVPNGSGRIPLTVENLQIERGKGHTVVFRYYVLEKYLNTNTIEQNFLDAIAADCAAARTAGAKLIPRFAYSTAGGMIAPYNADPPVARVISHIQQLGDVLSANADVVDAIQAGFIGMWGEWYYTDNFGDLGSMTNQQWLDRKAVVDALFSELDPRIFVLIRYVGVMRRLIDAEPTNQNYALRMGHHNDAFLAETHDWGTYGTFSDGYTDEQNRTWLAARYANGHFPMMGESANFNPPRSNLPTAIAELSEYRWSTLNPLYHAEVLSSWGAEGRAEVAAKLGYRLTLGEVTATVASGLVNLSFTVTNDGWAAPYRQRPVLIDFVSGGTTVTRTLSVDIREWGPGVSEVSGQVQAPAEGTWEIFLRVVDASSSLQNNPLHTLAFANQDSFDPVTGRTSTGQQLFIVTATPVWVAGAYIEAANGATPTHQVGDAICVVAIGGSTLAVPSGWTQVASVVFQGWLYGRVAWKIATATNDPTGNWGDGWALAVGIWRNCTIQSASMTLQSTTLPALTLNTKDWVGVCSISDNATLPAVPSGTVSRAEIIGSDAIRWADTNGSPGTWTSRTVARQTIGASLRLAPTTVSEPPPPPPPSEGITAASTYGWGIPEVEDQFSGSQLHEGWVVSDWVGYQGNGFYRPSQVVVANDRLTITGDRQGNTGLLQFWDDTRMGGRWESRIRIPQGYGDYHPVALLWPITDVWPGDGEIDYVEMSGSAEAQNFSLHHGGAGSPIVQTVPIEPRRDWHNYAVEWVPGSHVAGFMDGVEYFRSTTGLPPVDMVASFQLDWMNFAAPTEPDTVMEVDWFRIYGI